MADTTLTDKVLDTLVKAGLLTIEQLASQRRRWHRGLGQTLWRHRSVMGNRRYGALGGMGISGGNAYGCYRLALAYETSRGVAADPAQARALRDKACKAGHTDACEAR